jgi:MtaA/CmuA family methyltransferase
MNGVQRIRAALAGDWPDRRPVMLHNFMMAARESGISMRRFRSSPEAIAQAFVQSVEKYGYDGVLVDVDTATLAGATGVPIYFPDNEPAVVNGPLLTKLEQFDDLEPVDIAGYERVQVWLEGVRLLVREIGNEIYIRGNCDQAPFSLAAMMRGMENFLTDLLDPETEERVTRLLDYALDVGVSFLKLMAATGAHMISNGDSTSGTSVISPRLHRKFAQPYQKRMAEAAHGLGLPWTLHVCGNTDPILADLVSTGADALELDHKTDSRHAHDTLAERSVFIGNLDPSNILAYGSAADVERATRKLMSTFSDTPRFILNAGCAISPDTPPENIHTMIRVASEYSGS